MSNYASKLIKCSLPAEGVLQVTLARPPVNAYSSELSAELQRHFEEASVDPDVRCVVLTSELDKGFTAGLDLLCVRSLDSPAVVAHLVRSDPGVGQAARRTSFQRETTLRGQHCHCDRYVPGRSDRR